MQAVTLKFSNDDARYLMYALRKRYGKDKRATIRGLCDIAVRTEIAAQAKEDLAEAERVLREEYSGEEANNASDDSD